MPVVFFTFHAYRSWRADNPRGYVQRDDVGVKPPSPELAAFRESIATQNAVAFSPSQMELILNEMSDICERRDIKPFGAAVTTTHIHLLAGWNHGTEPKQIQDKLKQGIGFVLAKDAGVKGKKWLSRGGVPESVTGDGHFAYIVREYLPKHENERGVWRVYAGEIPASEFWA